MRKRARLTSATPGAKVLLDFISHNVIFVVFLYSLVLIFIFMIVSDLVILLFL